MNYLNTETCHERFTSCSLTNSLQKKFMVSAPLNLWGRCRRPEDICLPGADRGLTPMSSTQGQLKIGYQKDDITKVAKNLNTSEKSLKKAHFNRASLKSSFSGIDFEQN